MTTLAPRQRPPPRHRPRHARPDARADARRAPAARPDPLLPLKEGIGAWSVDFFTTDPTGRFLGDPGGIKSAISGTIEMVALASAIAIPFGIGVALYLVEYGKDVALRQPRALLRRRDDRRAVGRLRPLRLHRPRGHQDRRDVRGLEGLASRWRCSCCRWSPARPRSCSTSCPTRLREAALALGAPRWRVDLPHRPADGAARPRHRLAARRRARGGRDRAAAVHRRLRLRHPVRPLPADELAAAADLQRRQPGPGPARPARVGRRPHAGRARPAS